MALDLWRAHTPFHASGDNGSWLPEYGLHHADFPDFSRRSSKIPQNGRPRACQDQTPQNEPMGRQELKIGDLTYRVFELDGSASSCSAACRKCRDIPYTLFTGPCPQSYIHHPDLDALSESASSGCCLCWFFEKNIAPLIPLIKTKEHERKDDLSYQISLRSSQNAEHQDSGSPMCIYLHCGGSYSRRIYWQFANGEGIIPGPDPDHISVC